MSSSTNESGRKIHAQSRIFSASLKTNLHFANSIQHQLTLLGIVFCLIITIRHLAGHDADKNLTRRSIRALVEQIAVQIAVSGKENEMEHIVQSLLEEKLERFGGLPMSRPDDKQGGTLIWEYSRHLTNIINQEKDSKDISTIMLVYTELAELAIRAGCKEYAESLVGVRSQKANTSKVKSNPKGLKRVLLSIAYWLSAFAMAFVALGLLMALLAMINFEILGSDYWQLPVFWLITSLLTLYFAKKLSLGYLQNLSKYTVATIIAVGTLIGAAAWIYDANDHRLGEQKCSLYYWDGACVPNSYTDIDCDDVDGQAKVLNEDEDIYSLDRDGDGIACEPNISD